MLSNNMIRLIITVIIIITIIIIIVISTLTTINVNPYIKVDDSPQVKCEDTLVLKNGYHNKNNVNQQNKEYEIRYDITLECDKCLINSPNFKYFDLSKFNDIFEPSVVSNYKFYNLTSKKIIVNYGNINYSDVKNNVFIIPTTFIINYCNESTSIYVNYFLKNKTIIEPFYITVIFLVLLLCGMFSLFFYTIFSNLYYNELYYTHTIPFIIQLSNTIFLFVKLAEICYKYNKNLPFFAYNFKIFILYNIQFCFIFIPYFLEIIIRYRFKRIPRKEGGYIVKLNRCFICVIVIVSIISIAITLKLFDIKSNSFRIKKETIILNLDYLYFVYVINSIIYTILYLRFINICICRMKNL